MSVPPRETPPVPEETRRIALAAFPRGDLYMRLRDELGASTTLNALPPSFQPVGCRRRRRSTWP
jgi:hypothetical protein